MYTRRAFLHIYIGPAEQAGRKSLKKATLYSDYLLQRVALSDLKQDMLSRLVRNRINHRNPDPRHLHYLFVLHIPSH